MKSYKIHYYQTGGKMVLGGKCNIQLPCNINLDCIDGFCKWNSNLSSPLNRIIIWNPHDIVNSNPELELFSSNILERIPDDLITIDEISILIDEIPILYKRIKDIKEKYDNAKKLKDKLTEWNKFQALRFVGEKIIKVIDKITYHDFSRGGEDYPFTTLSMGQFQTLQQLQNHIILSEEEKQLHQKEIIKLQTKENKHKFDKYNKQEVERLSKNEIKYYGNKKGIYGECSDDSCDDELKCYISKDKSTNLCLYTNEISVPYFETQPIHDRNPNKNQQSPIELTNNEQKELEKSFLEINE